VFPGGVSFLSGAAFLGIGRESITFSSAPVNFCMDEDYLSDFSGRVLVRYFGQDPSVRIGSSIEALSDGRFTFHKSIVSVTFDSDSKLSRLETLGFCESGVRSIAIPGSVTDFCDCCCVQCDSLESITFSSDCKLLGRSSDSGRVAGLGCQ
jgi:hypothetical protein